MALSSRRLSEAQRGVALIEVIIFMVVIAIASGALLTIFAKTNRGSAELMINRQAIAIAEAMLNEVLAAPFTYCDPNPADANFASAVSPAGCAIVANRELLSGGPEAGETRLGPTFFDNVNDYHNFTMGPPSVTNPVIVDRAGNVVPGLGGYTLTVTIAPVAAAGNWNGILASDMAVVTVTVTSRLLQAPVVLQGMRSRYAPNTLPPP